MEIIILCFYLHLIQPIENTAGAVGATGATRATGAVGAAARYGLYKNDNINNTPDSISPGLHSLISISNLGTTITSPGRRHSECGITSRLPCLTT